MAFSSLQKEASAPSFFGYNSRRLIAVLLLLAAVMLAAACSQSDSSEGPAASDSSVTALADSALATDSTGQQAPDTTAQPQATPQSVPPAKPANTDTAKAVQLPDSSQKPPVSQAAPARQQPAGEGENPVNNLLKELMSTMSGGAIGGETAEKPKTEKQKEESWAPTPQRVVFSILAFMVALLAIRYLTQFLEAVAERWTTSRLTIKRLIPVLRILGWTFVIYEIIVDILQLPSQTLVAIGASASVGVALASQDILKNIFGGIMVLVDRPFQVGDKVQVGSFYGEVMQIGLRTVRIVTPDDNLVSIPNGEIMNQSVSNANAGESNCQVVAEFYLPPDIDMVKARKIAYRAAAVSRYIYLNKPIAVIFKNEVHEGRSLVKMRLKAYVLDIRYEFAFSSEMTEIVLKEFMKVGLINVSELLWQTPAPQNAH